MVMPCSAAISSSRAVMALAISSREAWSICFTTATLMAVPPVSEPETAGAGAAPEEAELLPPEQAARPAIMVRDRAAAVNFFIMSCFFIVFSSKKQNLFGWAMEGPVPAALTWERSQ